MARTSFVKAGAREALAELAKLGVDVKLVTGDNEQVTRHVCGELGLRVTGTPTGTELGYLSDGALLANVVPPLAARCRYPYQ